MARVKLSEFRAKKLIARQLGYDYEGISIDFEDNNSQKAVSKLPEGSYVVKVDQATKKRNKLGLVKLNRSKTEILDDVAAMAAKGYRYFLAEPIVKHDTKVERFLALMRTEQGIEIHYSASGGVDIEEHPEDVTKLIIAGGSQKLIKLPGLSAERLGQLIELFNKNHMVYLEINPLLIEDSQLTPLDAAVEVDSTAELAVQGAWTGNDVRSSNTQKTDSEKAVESLQAISVSALTLRVINPDGKILLMLSGGGASLVVADEFDAHGLSDELINYGEYSGAPNEEELYKYALATIKLLKDSRATKKIIVIAGGVANFTDIAVTFKGIIRAFEKEKDYLKKNDVSVFVRRGGPNQQKGLTMMEDFLIKIGLKHKVHGPDVSIARLVKEVAEEVKR
ncbi:hypothetical protein A3F05_00015 [Candidatus Saccharibacteria bacterium RIFCSPHIGHO2_12_FULL_47_17]|nr:MAG: hypothetical protein A3F05_00015 [Candidatus Saccharibacteria bacterium RIFCSPHIGHO2_12_FULL_47_17]